MAKIVIAGSSDCPHYAKVELLADQLSMNLPSFKLTKIVKKPEEWSEWSRQCCEKRGWHQYKSPIVWRELVNQGGKGILIGGANEFQEYVKAYYDFESDLVTQQQLAVAKDNARYAAEAEAEEAALRAQSRPLRVLVTAAGGATAYQLMPLLADGSVFGCHTELAFTLYDTCESREMEGLAMEVEDLALPLVRSVRCSRDLGQALACGVDLLVLLDEIPLLAEPTDAAARSDWLRRNAKLYRGYAAAVAAAGCGGPAGVRILVAGRGPVNFGAGVLLERTGGRAPGGLLGPHPDRVVATPRLLERQAKAAVAASVGASPAGVGDLVVWGDPAGGHTVELGRATVAGHEGAITEGPPGGYRRPLQDVLWDQDWLLADFPRLLARRQAESLRCGRDGHFAASSARAVADTLRDWWLGGGGSGQGMITSLGVASKGWYGIPEGLVFSFPVRFQPEGAWSVVEDFDLTEETLQKLQDLAEEFQKDFELGTGGSSKKK